MEDRTGSRGDRTLGCENTTCHTTTVMSTSLMPGSSEDRDGRSRHEDIEIVTGHYRGAHASCRSVGIQLLSRHRRHVRRLREHWQTRRLSSPASGEELLG